MVGYFKNKKEKLLKQKLNQKIMHQLWDNHMIKKKKQILKMWYTAKSLKKVF